jgi:hypothetical protein
VTPSISRRAAITPSLQTLPILPKSGRSVVLQVTGMDPGERERASSSIHRPVQKYTGSQRANAMPDRAYAVSGNFLTGVEWKK